MNGNYLSSPVLVMFNFILKKLALNCKSSKAIKYVSKNIVPTGPFKPGYKLVTLWYVSWRVITEEEHPFKKSSAEQWHLVIQSSKSTKIFMRVLASSLESFIPIEQFYPNLQLKKVIKQCPQAQRRIWLGSMGLTTYTAAIAWPVLQGGGT